MSIFSKNDPYNDSKNCPESIEQFIIPRVGDIGNFQVFRALPSRDRQMVGPFIFWDQMGPGEFLTNQGVDVRPHPHIGLSTVTYLYEGEVHHRDSLGMSQVIVPGEINLMTAGSGIVHSERTPEEARTHNHSLFGIQSWLALPKEKEEMDAAFVNVPKGDLPTINDNGVQIRIIAGNVFGESSEVDMHHPTLYADIKLDKGATIVIPADYEERAIYSVTGKINIDSKDCDERQMLILRPGKTVDITALDPARLMLLGGEAMDGPRHIWWNLVSSSKDRLEQAKQDWKNDIFPKVPGDDKEFIPLPSS